MDWEDSKMIQSIGTANFTTTDLDRLAQELNRDGICVIRGLFDRDLMRWAQAFDSLFRTPTTGRACPREIAPTISRCPGFPIRQCGCLHNPVILGVLERVFAQEYVMVQLGVDVPQGSDYQEIWDFRPLFSDQVVTPLYALSVNFPLVEVTRTDRFKWLVVRLAA